MNNVVNKKRNPPFLPGGEAMKRAEEGSFIKRYIYHIK